MRKTIAVIAALVALLIGVLLFAGFQQKKKEGPSKGFYTAKLSLKEVYNLPCDQQVPLHLDWCSTDHGYNEGASCGLQALTGTGVPDLPANAGQQVLGNLWDRTNMMGATKAAWKLGAKDAAIDAAICCQIHNPPAHECLQSRRDLVGQWLDAHK